MDNIKIEKEVFNMDNIKIVFKSGDYFGVKDIQGLTNDETYVSFYSKDSGTRVDYLFPLDAIKYVEITEVAADE